MENEVDRLLSNSYAASLVYVSLVVLSLIVFLFVFELVTKYNCWSEIKKGNLAVAMATGGQNFRHLQYFPIFN